MVIVFSEGSIPGAFLGTTNRSRICWWHTHRNRPCTCTAQRVGKLGKAREPCDESLRFNFRAAELQGRTGTGARGLGLGGTLAGGAAALAFSAAARVVDAGAVRPTSATSRAHVARRGEPRVNPTVLDCEF